MYLLLINILMKIFKILLILFLFVIIITGCNLKINLNSNLNQGNIQVEDNGDQPTDENAKTSGQKTSDFTFDTSKEGMIKQILIKETNDVWIDDLTILCESDVMMFAQPLDSALVILTQFNPGTDKPVSNLYSLNLQEKECGKLTVTKELSDFGARVLSPDQSKLAVALEINEARILKILDLLADESKIVVTLGDGETLNGGYGALSNHFSISWLDNSKIQYTVYEDTYKDYDIDAPETLEKVIEVRITTIE